MLAFLGAWTVLELVLLFAVVLPLAWATGRDRNGVDNPKWWILSAGFVAYLIYYAVTAPTGDWWPHVFSKAFWLDGRTWRSIGTYLAIGVAYAVVEMLSCIIEEKREIKSFWARFIENNQDVAEYVKGIEDRTEPVVRQLRAFCSDWNGNYRVVKLTVHDLEATPQPSINATTLQLNVLPWIILWPGYLVSLIFGRVLDRVVNSILRCFRYLGTLVLNVAFRNTFKVKTIIK